MGEPYVSHTNIVVTRSIDNGTDLMEFWHLESCYFNNSIEYDNEEPEIILHCHIANKNVIKNKCGIPTSDQKSAYSSCRFNEAPNEIQNKFIERLDEMKKMSNNIS